MSKKETKILNGVNAAVTVLLILAVVLCMYVVIQVLGNGCVNLGGFMIFRVVTGSMEPTIPVGSMLIARQTDIATIEIGDIVCFYTQDQQIYGSVVTHRVVDIFTSPDGKILLETKGDANLVSDVYFVDQQALVGKVVQLMGNDSAVTTVFNFLTDKVGFLGCIVIPCLVLATLVLRSCVGNIQEELRRAKEDIAMDVPDEPHILSDMTEEEYRQMVERIRSELIREMAQNQAPNEGESNVEILEERSSEETTE